MSATLLEPRTSAPVLDEPKAPSPAPTKPGPERLVSLDAYRGFIMLVMASSGFAFATVNTRIETAVLAVNTVATAGSPAGPFAALAGTFPQRAEAAPASPTWHFLGYQFDHVPWVGCSFWDLIQPSFMFMVGVAIPYSIASRRAKGQKFGWMLFHAVWRSILLILLAVFLSSPMVLGKESAGYKGPTTNWIFVNVLAQIGMGYVFVFLLAGRGWKVQVGALALILVGYTLLFGLWPVGTAMREIRPGAANDYGTPPGWIHDEPEGWFSQWNKNANAAHDIDTRLLNQFPRAERFYWNAGGYHTLNFIPSMATMIFGLMAGELLRGDRKKGQKFLLLALAAAGCLAVGWLMGQWTSPIVKRIWTPSWAVFSSGWTFAMLACFFAVIDVIGLKRWAFPLTVVGMNSIAIYVMSQLLRPWIRRSLETHFGQTWLSGDYGPVVLTTTTLLVLWLFCLWMYRQRIFLRI
jgi:predicted acyltransferase